MIQTQKRWPSCCGALINVRPIKLVGSIVGRVVDAWFDHDDDLVDSIDSGIAAGKENLGKYENHQKR